MYTVGGCALYAMGKHRVCRPPCPSMSVSLSLPVLHRHRPPPAVTLLVRPVIAFSWSLGSPSLSSNLQAPWIGSLCFLPSSGLPGIHHHFQLSARVSGIQTQVVMPEQEAFSLLKRLPGFIALIYGSIFLFKVSWCLSQRQEIQAVV